MIGRMVAVCAGAAVLGGCTGPDVPAAAQSPQPAPASDVCRMDFAGRTLPAEIRETSGLARGRRNPGVFWTHNDSGGDPEIFAVDSAGRIAGRVRVEGASATDWEDIESGPCASGNCLFVADIGDNAGRRDHVTLYEIPEPAPGDTRAAPSRVVRARYPEGPRDAESLFVLPDGTLNIVSKGRQGDVAVYRVPAAGGGAEPVVLQRVVGLQPHPEFIVDQVTAATASPDGRWLAIRSYRNLFFYRTADLAGGTTTPVPIRIDLVPLHERQGESIALDANGTVWMTSEAEVQGLPTWSRLSCRLPAR